MPEIVKILAAFLALMAAVNGLIYLIVSI